MKLTFFATLFITFFLVSSCGQTVFKTNKKMETTNNLMEEVVLGGGCFWCMEAVFQRLAGVEKIESGYTGGLNKKPTYKEVCTGSTGHTEVIKVTFDPKKTSFEEVLKVFFTVHDPTTLNQQGNDVGTQYRSAIYFTTDKQKQLAEEIISSLNKEKVYDNPIVTEVTPLQIFYKAEDYHQNYFNQNKQQNYCQFVIQPKLEKFEKIFKDKLKK